MKHVTLITDGACSNNPGRGGWGAILRCGIATKELCGSALMTTCNRMEMMAVIEGLKALRERCRVTVRTDSRLVITLCTKTGPRWNSGVRKKAPKNLDLLEQLMALVGKHEVHFEWVRGHTGDPDNERCDRLAVAMSRTQFNLATGEAPRPMDLELAAMRS